jgi:predicted ATPase/DNA-binding SARP family transcriptional activator
LEFRVLGPLEVVRDGVPLDLGGAKQRAVLAALLVERGRVLGAERLADLVWEGAPPASADTTLRSYISNLRKALRPDDVLLTRSQGYVLEISDDSLDAVRFERLTEEGRQAHAGGDHELARSVLTDAAALWRGRAYGDVAYSSFAVAESGRLEQVRLNGIEDLLESRLALGDHAALTGELESLTSEHPMRERLWAARMIALYRSGRQGDALKVYEEARHQLADELGIDPSPELRRLHDSIVRQSDQLDIPARVARTGKQTLSFLFTDIELSTEILLGAEDEYAYASLMEDHRAALREAFVAHGGQRIRTWGDAFFSAFNTAADAVRAAVSAQLALHQNGDGNAVRVRMGLHSGEAAIVADDYVGLAVHAAARIQSASHGGQILVSQSTKELIDADLGDGVAFLDLGPHQLKDIPEPMRLFQLTHPSLPKSFPPPRTMSTLPHNLPGQVTSFIGRTDDVRAVIEALESARVVTLTGVGGVGKTRLSIEAGAEALPRYPDGVWLCELAPVGDDEAVVHTMAREIGVAKVDVPLRESLLAFLRRRRALVVLDNCEHVIGPAANVIEELVRSCPGVDVLATSREPIGVEGEHIRPVRSLCVPDDLSSDLLDTEAIQLFVDRARAVRPDFEIGPHNSSAVAEICRRLDGIPLAIELAAARTSSMGPLEIAARLDRRFRFLRSGRRTAIERHRTLQAAIDWSYALMTEEEQLLFERLSVFVGGFTLSSAEHVCSMGLDADVVELIDALVGKSILEADTSGTATRYTMLETLRQYAQDKLEERGDSERFMRTHCDFFANLAEEADAGIRGRDQEEWVRRCDEEIDNFRAAHRFAVASSDLDLALRLVAGLAWYSGLGQMSEVEEVWTVHSLALPGANSHELCPIILGSMAQAAWTRGRLSAAKEFGERALDLAPRDGDRRRALAVHALAAVAMFEGRLEDGLALGGEMIQLARAYGESFLEGVWLLNLGLIEGYGGDIAKGLELIEKAKPFVESSGAPSLLAHADYVTGEVIGDTDPQRAIACLDQAVSLWQATKSFFQVGIALVGAVSLRGRHGDPVDALRRYPDVIEHWTRVRMWTQQWNTLQNLVELFGRLEMDESAVALLGASDASPTAPRPYGAHDARLSKLVETMKHRLGETEFSEAWERGRRLSDEDAVAFALTTIREALEGVTQRAAVS